MEKKFIFPLCHTSLIYFSESSFKTELSFTVWWYLIYLNERNSVQINQLQKWIKTGQHCYDFLLYWNIFVSLFKNSFFFVLYLFGQMCVRPLSFWSFVYNEIIWHVVEKGKEIKRFKEDRSKNIAFFSLLFSKLWELKINAKKMNASRK